MMSEEQSLVDHMRELAEDLHSVYGHTEIGSALSKGADEIERLRKAAEEADNAGA